MRLLAASALAALPGLRAASAQAPDAVPYGNAIHDDRLYFHGVLNQIEGRTRGDDTYLRWSGRAWIGDDYNRLWLRSEGRYGRYGGRVEDGEHEALYGRPISRYFDVVGGVRTDIDSGTGRTWAAIGLQGLAVQ